VYTFDDVFSAYQAAVCAAQPGDCVVVFGSFYCVAEVLKKLSIEVI
jgi:folylpolyglutamate synthase/dihydropteroate synthase